KGVARGHETSRESVWNLREDHAGRAEDCSRPASRSGCRGDWTWSGAVDGNSTAFRIFYGACAPSQAPANNRQAQPPSLPAKAVRPSRTAESTRPAQPIPLTDFAATLH